jgi:hypothetical protein
MRLLRDCQDDYPLSVFFCFDFIGEEEREAGCLCQLAYVQSGEHFVLCLVQQRLEERFRYLDLSLD